MLKTIKTVKEMRLDELIKHVWENPQVFEEKEEKNFYAIKDSQKITFYNTVGIFVMNGYGIGKDDLFRVEVEEEITKDTKFEWIVVVYYTDVVGKLIKSKEDSSISDIATGWTDKIYALVNGKLELIWERETECHSSY